MPGSTVDPFPWTALQRASIVDTRWLTAARSALSPPSIAASCLDALASLTSCKLDAHVVSAGATSTPPRVAGTVNVRIAVEATAVPWSFVLEVEAPLLVALVARATRRVPPRVVHPGLSTTVSPALMGAFAAILCAAIRRVAGPVRVLDATNTPLATSPEDVAGYLVVRVDGDSYRVRVVLPSAVLSPFVELFPSVTQCSLPIEIPVVAYRSVATVSEVAAIAVGDAWMLGFRADTLRARNVWLCPGDSTLGFAATLEPDGRLVLREGIEELGWSPMPDPNDNPTLAQAVGEVSVVIRVEIGAARMKAREWAALNPGDVVGMGSKVGSKVTLRVSGVAVAEGDLVDVEGELGVRIRRRFGDK